MFVLRSASGDLVLRNRRCRARGKNVKARIRAGHIEFSEARATLLRDAAGTHLFPKTPTFISDTSDRSARLLLTSFYPERDAFPIACVHAVRLADNLRRRDFIFDSERT